MTYRLLISLSRSKAQTSFRKHQTAGVASPHQFTFPMVYLYLQLKIFLHSRIKGKGSRLKVER